MTLKVMSRPGRITLAGHIMTIVRNILGEEVANGVGKIRMLKEKGEEVCLLHQATKHRVTVHSKKRRLCDKVLCLRSVV